MTTEIELYAVGLLGEECCEVGQMTGKAVRFGIDTPHSVSGKPVAGLPTCRDAISHECGDVLAAISYACERGVIDRNAMQAQCARKLAKLLDPESKDFLGRRLAP